MFRLLDVLQAELRLSAQHLPAGIEVAGGNLLDTAEGILETPLQQHGAYRGPVHLGARIAEIPGAFQFFLGTRAVTQGDVGASQQPPGLGVLGIDLQHVLELDDGGAHVALVAVLQRAIEAFLEILAAFTTGRQAERGDQCEGDAQASTSRSCHGIEFPAARVATIVNDGGAMPTTERPAQKQRPRWASGPVAATVS